MDVYYKDNGEHSIMCILTMRMAIMEFENELDYDYDYYNGNSNYDLIVTKIKKHALML